MPNQIPVTPTIPNIPSSAAPKRMNRPPMGTSLKEMGIKKEQPKAVQPLENTNQPIQDSAFTNEDLNVCWEQFANQIQQKVYLKNTMINCKPTLQENCFFEVAVHNPGQQDELANAAIDILSYLRAQLHNSKIQMRVRILESNEKHLAYTSSEKYEYLLGINPILGKLKEEFDLRID